MLTNDPPEEAHPGASGTLRAAHASFRHLVERSPFGVYVLDAGLRFVAASPAASQSLAPDGRALNGRDFTEVVLGIWPEHFAREVLSRFVHTLATGESYATAETLEVRKDHGREEAYDWRIERIVLPDGRHGVLCHFYELTERRRHEARLRESHERLHESDKRKDEFMALLAHELRNPLAPIRVGVSLLRKATPQDDESERVFRIIERQLSLMTRLIDDLLDVARVSRGMLELRRTRVDVAEVVGLALEQSLPQIEGADHRLELAPAPVPVEVDADPLRLSQVLVNLVNNAARYTPRGGEIRVGWRRVEDEVAIFVEDSGPGIPPDMRAQVFRAFVQIERPGAQGGVGLGLALARSIVEMHGGSLGVTDGAHGRGSRFEVRLPALAQTSQ